MSFKTGKRVLVEATIREGGRSIMVTSPAEIIPASAERVRLALALADEVTIEDWEAYYDAFRALDAYDDAKRLETDDE